MFEMSGAATVPDWTAPLLSVVADRRADHCPPTNAASMSTAAPVIIRVMTAPDVSRMPDWAAGPAMRGAPHSLQNRAPELGLRVGVPAGRSLWSVIAYR